MTPCGAHFQELREVERVWVLRLFEPGCSFANHDEYAAVATCVKYKGDDSLWVYGGLARDTSACVFSRAREAVTRLIEGLGFTREQVKWER